MISPVNIATRGYTAFLNVPLSMATDGYMSLLQGSFPFTGGGKKSLAERLKREDEEILFIIKEFIKWLR